MNQSWFFERTLNKLTRRKNKRIHIIAIKIEKGKVAADSMVIQKIVIIMKNSLSTNWKTLRK